ncbi:fibronectin type III domain-containing protein [Actinoplanes awajinensis]|uniref:Fibronectin type-III domain-containing protein n=1 Tax=Actinoplanes awajinensis subsp. mycoplanecinus TaxID=135947 RepID=A0A101JEI4_9ACTN|nr:fibronectin type III domain-containing protein [Actinoplanes awajinensis]KUL25320.1 hypothetical protein ADL15_41105 [Actinoplanes awajinensis subsp. mycoplanecinus]
MEKTWRLPGHIVAALCALVLVVAGIPARAIAAEPARWHGPASVEGVTVTETEDSVTVTLENDDIARVDSGLLLTWMDELTTAAPVLTDAIKVSFDAHPLDMGLSAADREPWSTSDAELSISSVGNSISIVLPMDEAHTEASWWMKLVASAVGYLSQLSIRISCYAAFNVGSAVAGPVCAGLGAFTGVMVYQAIVIFVDHKQAEPEQWAQALAFAVVAAAGAVAWESGLNDFAKTKMRPLFEKLRDATYELAKKAGPWIKRAIGDGFTWLGDRLGELSQYISDKMSAAYRALFESAGVGTVKVMVVGDSMSHGREGDYTWRYRLWQWFQSQHIAVDFVGPYSGTQPPDEAAPPRPPLLQGETEAGSRPRTSGSYANGVVPFDSNHFAVWGRQANQDKQLIREQVAAWQPDLLLVGLGFNDLGWFVSGPDGTLASMKSLVDNARAAKPNLKFALANVPQRTKINGRDDLPVNTDTYNRMLATAIPGWSTAQSPVRLVDWRGDYRCEVGGCPAGYDGLHPNALGEYQIAHAFEQTLHDGYGLGANVPAVPATAPGRALSTPAQVSAVASPGGFTVTWNPVFGASGYTVRSRLVGQSAWSEMPASAARYDNGWVLDGQQWEAQVRANYGDQASGWSGVVGTTVHPQTAAGASNILTLAALDGLDIAWDPPTGNYTSSIERYSVLTYDQDTPGAWLNAVGIKGQRAHIGGLISGHRYIVAIQSWNAAGGGFPSTGHAIVVGAGKPADPTGLTVTATDPTTVQLAWTAAAGAGGYEVRIRNINNNTTSYEDSGTTTHGIAYLFPGYWNYEYCVRAYNGEQKSGWSNCVVLPPNTAGSPGQPPGQ